MPEDNKIEIHSEEIQEIMGFIPSWMIRCGTVVIFSLFSMILIGCYFYKYPEIISTSITLTTFNPPAHLISKSTGKIEKIFVNDGEELKSGRIIALLESSSNYQDIIKLEIFLKGLNNDWNIEIRTIKYPENLLLGDLQNNWCYMNCSG